MLREIVRNGTTYLVIVHHSVVNFINFGNGDRMRWFASIWSCCSTIASSSLSCFWSHDSLARRGTAGYLCHCAWRLGVPLVISTFVLT
jgi:hypothetical protein